MRTVKSTKNKSSKCPRVITRSKYERNTDLHRKWWEDTFAKLEADATIPPDQKLEVLQSIFPLNVLERILAILTVYENDTWRGVKPMSLTTMRSDTVLSCMGDGSTESSIAKLPVSAVPSSQLTNELLHKKKRVAGPDNPYMNFFKRRPDRAAIWRTLPPLSLEEMNLTQKAEAIAENIANSFVSWLREVVDPEIVLDARTVIKMFEIGFNNHAATSLSVRVKEMPSITQAMATARGLSEIASRTCLHEQITRDKRASNKPARKIAFGKLLPPELRYEPPKNDTRKWLRSEHVREDLVTMSAVWEGITHLRSTRAYCLWLLEHPQVPHPTYLEQKGILDEAYLREPQYSVDTETLVPTELPPGIIDFSAEDAKMPTLDTVAKESTTPKSDSSSPSLPTMHASIDSG